MEMYLINLFYFLLAFPIIIIAFLLISKLNKEKEKNRLIIIIVLSGALFIVRFFLILFGETIGIMPYLVEDILFYSFLTIFGLTITWFYVVKIEKVSFKDIGWKIENVKKSIFFGLLAFIPLICIFPLIIFLTNIQFSTNITLGKLITSLGFALLGAFYEEVLFRGVIQNHIMEITNGNEIKSIIFTAILFTITHLFYLPFIGFGIYYIFVFIMALILSILRLKCDQLACAILHGGIVFILIIFV